MRAPKTPAGTEGSEPPEAWRGRFSHLVGGTLVRALYAGEMHGAQHVPEHGPVILAANHTGFLDGAVVLGLAPRPSHFLVLKQTFEGPVLGPLLRFSGQIAIDQQRGDRTALNRALQVLGRGGVIGIFPEGGRGRGDLSAAAKGVGWLAMQSGATVIPTACLGTRRTGDLAASWPRLRSRLVVDFGASVPLEVPDGLPGRVRLERVSEQIRVTLADHVAQASVRHGLPLPTDVPPDILQL